MIPGNSQKEEKREEESPVSDLEHEKAERRGLPAAVWRWQGSSEERLTLECLGRLLRILAGGQGDKKADELQV